MSGRQKKVFQVQEDAALRDRIEALENKMRDVESKFQMLQVQHANLVSHVLYDGRATFRALPLTKDIGDASIGDTYDDFPDSYVKLFSMKADELTALADFYGLDLASDSREAKSQGLLEFFFGIVPSDYN
jgi:hypothetical protein